jgi:flagellar export protein FliJ
VKRFRFPLDPVRRWRGEQARAAEIGLERLLDERSVRQRALEFLQAGVAAEVAGVLESGTVDAVSLAALDAYRRHTAREGGRIRVEIGQCDQRIEEQRQRVVAARRQVRLLDRLQERHFEKWKAEAAREEEQLASDLFLARLNSPGWR